MRNKMKKLLAGLLSMVMVLSVATGCGEGSADEPERTTNAEYDELIEEVAALAGNVDSSFEVTKKITWLSWWQIDETQAAAELFKQVYGVPEAGNADYGKDADNIFEYIYIAYADRYEKMASMISSGDSPDMFQFEIINYPYSVYKGMFQSIDGIVDTTTEAWSATRETMDQFVWGGKNYCAITSLNLDEVMWYRRSIVEEAGLDDPYELYKAGNWNWNTFLEMCDKFQSSDADKYCTDGWHVPDKLLLTTGVPMISLTDGKLKSNLYDTNIERGMEFITNFHKEGYQYPRDILNGWSTSIMGWISGDILFNCDGIWAFPTLSNYATKLEWGTEDIFFVPFPQDPNSDKYYQSMKQDSYMLCMGSDNVEGFKAWTECVLATANNDVIYQKQREKDVIDYNWTDEQLDFVYELTHGALTPIFDFKAGIGQDIVDSSTVNNPVDCLVQWPYLTGTDADGNPITYTSIRSANEGQINSRIDELNATVA